MAETAPSAGGLRRRLGPALLVFYGVGVMVGAGIYVLIGAAAGLAGAWAPVAFLLAALVVAPTALSYAELSARIPEAGGESAYADAAFGLPLLAVAVGLLIVLAGIVSAAAVLVGGIGYLGALMALDPAVATLGLAAGLTAIACVGVVESLAFAALLTLIEVGGLLLVVWAGFSAPPSADFAAGAGPVAPAGLAGAVILAFFAFIGFEDLVNMAEETRNPGRTMPLAILTALGITALLYAMVSLAAVRAVPLDTLASSRQPMALVWTVGTGHSPAFLSAVAVLAALNGILAQIVMSARVLYGLGRRHRAFAALHVAHPVLGTPLRATLLVGALVTVAALLFPIVELATLTSAVLLVVFVTMNAALIALKRGPGRPPRRSACRSPFPGWAWRVRSPRFGRLW